MHGYELLKRNNMHKEDNHTEVIHEMDFERETQHTDHPLDHAPQKKKKVRVKEIIDGTILVRENVIRQLPFLLFLTLLGIIYIGNRFHAEKMVRQIEQLKVEVNNLRSEQITTTSELMNISRPSEVAALVESKGLELKESMEPPKKLRK